MTNFIVSFNFTTAFKKMDAFELEYAFDAVDSIADPFMDAEYDPMVQTGGDWYRLMLAASLGGAVVHGQTVAPTCETIAKVDEVFARNHAVARIHINREVKDTPHAGHLWQLHNLRGKGYHGTRTTNKARMLFNTEEWEPSTRVRAANAAFVGGLLAAQGCSIADAVEIAGAVAGEPVPESAVINTELPMSVLKHEAAATAKSNHVVYGYANTQKAITWDAHQFHEKTLPADAALDWSRVTTVARYVGEANSMVDDTFIKYASEFGVPYSLVTGSWASVWASDYILNVDDFRVVPRLEVNAMPTPALNDVYDRQASNLYDAIHRMANEVKVGLSDITIESLLKIAEAYKPKKGSRHIARGTELLGEATMHIYTAEAASNAVATSARSWDALVCAATELVGSNRQLKQACAAAVANFKQHRDFVHDLEPLFLELCDTPIWLRAFDYLKNALGNHYKAHDRMSKLKRSTLANSAPLDTPQVLTGRTRNVLTEPARRLATLALTGTMPLNRLSVDARRLVAHQNLDQHAALFASVNAHMSTTKKEWVQRYSRMAETYALSKTDKSEYYAVIYGAISKAFAMVNSYLLTRPADGFIDPQALTTSYVVAIAGNYVRKRHITKVNMQPLIGQNAFEQAALLDQWLKPKVTFTEIVAACHKRLFEFYSDIANGVAPRLVDDEAEEVTSALPPDTPKAVTEQDIKDLEAMFAEMEKPVQNLYSAVLNTYTSENQADLHARANGFENFLDAFEKMGDRARYDPETDYTNKGITAAIRQETAAVLAGDMPVI